MVPEMDLPISMQEVQDDLEVPLRFPADPNQNYLATPL